MHFFFHIFNDITSSCNCMARLSLSLSKTIFCCGNYDNSASLEPVQTILSALWNHKTVLLCVYSLFWPCVVSQRTYTVQCSVSPPPPHPKTIFRRFERVTKPFSSTRASFFADYSAFHSLWTSEPIL